MRKKLLSALLALCMVIGLLPAMTLPAAAAEGMSVVTSRLWTGQTLYNNTVYMVTSDTTLKAGAGQSALYVASGATTVIYIAAGVTLTVKGGNGGTGQGGGAGIYLPSNATLAVLGSGTLVATGGNGGSAGQGQKGGRSRMTYSTKDKVKIKDIKQLWLTAGTGGNGGVGGGGAGAAIGGSGASGGVGGSGASSVPSITVRTDNMDSDYNFVSFYAPDYSDVSGKKDWDHGMYTYSGDKGGDGGKGAAMGRLYVANTVTLSTTAGSAGSKGGSESQYSVRDAINNSWNTYDKNNFTSNHPTAIRIDLDQNGWATWEVGPGGVGGGGGAGGPIQSAGTGRYAGVGGGGGAGGGGGGGSAGLINGDDVSTKPKDLSGAKFSAGIGGRRGDSVGDSESVSYLTGYGNDFTNWKDGHFRLEMHAQQPDPASAGSAGDKGTILTSSPVNVDVTVTLDSNGGVFADGATTQTVPGSLGQWPTVTAKPTKAGQTIFKGYYTATTGGTRIYDENLRLVSTTAPTTTTPTLYAQYDTYYLVTYENGGGSGTVPTDTTKYLSGTSFTVRPGTGLTRAGADGTESFAGWSLTDGSRTKTVRPGNLYAGGTDNITLTALYGRAAVVKGSEEVLAPPEYLHRSWFDTTKAKKTEVKTITFQRGSGSLNLRKAKKSWAVDVGREGTIMAYAFANSEDSSMYDLYVVSDYRIMAPQDSRYLFENFINCTAITLDNFDTSRMTKASDMFAICAALTSLDVSGFDTSHVTSMYDMFADCVKLTSLDLSGWDTSRVTNMDSMFFHCAALTSLDLSGWNTSAVTTMYQMFDRCVGLTNLDLSGWDTSSVTNMAYMFQDCFALTSLDVSGWDTSAVTNMTSMFSGCRALTSLDLSGFNTAQVTYMSVMFYGCSALRSLDMRSADFSAVTATNDMFTGWNYNPIPVLYVKDQTAGDKVLSFGYGGTVQVVGAANVALLTALAETEPETRTASALTASVPSAQSNSLSSLTELGRVTAGDEVPYTLDVQYWGDVGTKSGTITVTDKLPDKMTYLEGSASLTVADWIEGYTGEKDGIAPTGILVGSMQYNAAANTVTFRVANLSPGAYYRANFKVTMADDLGTDYTEYRNTATYEMNGISGRSNTTMHYSASQPTSTKYTLSYMYTGPVPAGAPKIPPLEEYYAGTEFTVAETPSLNGYTFDGWYLGKSKVTGRQTMPANHLTLTGSWKKVAPTYISVTYTWVGQDNNQVDIPADAPIYTAGQVEKGGRVSIPDPPAAIEGFTFKGWTVEGRVLTEEEKNDGYFFSDKDVTFVGKWLRNSYTYSFRFEGDVPTGVSLPAGGSVKWGTVVETPNRTAPGYRFHGWTLNGESTGGGVAVPIGGATFIGTWTKVPMLTLYSGAVDSGVDMTSAVTSGTKTTALFDVDTGGQVTIRPVSREGLTFKEWQVTSGTADITETAPGSGVYTFAMPANGGEDVTIKALYTAKVTFIVQGGYWSDGHETDDQVVETDEKLNYKVREVTVPGDTLTAKLGALPTTMMCETTYYEEPGAWQAPVPTANTDITQDASFVYKYTPKTNLMTITYKASPQGGGKVAINYGGNHDLDWVDEVDEELVEGETPQGVKLQKSTGFHLYTDWGASLPAGVTAKEPWTDDGGNAATNHAGADPLIFQPDAPTRDITYQANLLGLIFDYDSSKGINNRDFRALADSVGSGMTEDYQRISDYDGNGIFTSFDLLWMRRCLSSKNVWKYLPRS